MPLPQRSLASTAAEHKDDHLALNASAPSSSTAVEHPAIHNAVHPTYGLPQRAFGSYSASEHLSDHNTMHAANFDPLTLRTLTYGPTSDYTQLAGSTVLASTTAWSTIASTVAGATAGTKFWVTGTHRVTSELALKTGMEFHGAPGSEFVGAVLLDGTWTQDGSTWWHSHTPTFAKDTSTADCVADGSGGFFLGRDRNLLSVDGVPYKQVDSLAKVTGDRYFVDHTANRVYIAVDPSGKVIEASRHGYLLRGSSTDMTAVTDVVVRNITCRNFAPPVQQSCVDSRWSERWNISYSEFAACGGHGVRNSGNNGVIARCRMTRNLQAGVGGSTSSGQWDRANDLLVEYNNIGFNWIGVITRGFESNTKWSNTTNLTIRRNWCHDSDAFGLWTDINNLYALLEENLSENIGRSGIFHEIGYDAIIRNNDVINCGHSDATDASGGIRVANSERVQVYNNRVSDCYHSIILMQQLRTTQTRRVPWNPDDGHQLADCLIRDNRTFGNRTGARVGAWKDDGTDIFGAARKLRFRSNTHYSAAATTNMFHWRLSGITGAVIAWNDWNSQGQDVAVTETDSFTGQTVSYPAGTRADL